MYGFHFREIFYNISIKISIKYFVHRVDINNYVLFLTFNLLRLIKWDNVSQIIKNTIK